MGFDNECILSIQSLAGEYFCPVCRLLVYPNEALQSQCTHLYCKPCLTYVVSTTRACPYDGYLVTEADSKPLIETNKLLAETIGKIGVHCLFHRSGCSWLGSLSDCVSHCSGCAYGNSPVVCNKCGIQIVHRQVQEHAQSCPGVPAQAQADVAAATSASADQTQSASQTSLTTASQNATTVSSSQAQAAVQTAVPTAEQWYQQQHQQYQQYYQQNPGYDQYQQQYQQYYPYQPQNIPAPASNSIVQPQTQPLASNLQAPPANQPQNQAQQVHPGIAPQTYGNLQPQPQAYTQYPQTQPQIQTQTQNAASIKPQTQNPTSQAMTAHPYYPQPQVGPGPLPQNPVPPAGQLPQQPSQIGPPHSHATVPSQQQQALFPPAQQSAKQPYFQQSVQPVQQRPVMQPVQQTFPQQIPAPAQFPLQGQPRLFPQQAHVYPHLPQSVVASSHGALHVNSPNPVGRPSVPIHGVQYQPYPHYGGGVSRPSAYQLSTNPILKSSNQMQLPSEQQYAKPTNTGSVDPQPALVANADAEREVEKSSADVKPASSESKVTEEGKADQTSKNYTETNPPVEMQGGLRGEPIVKEGNLEGALSHFSNGDSDKVITDDTKDVLKDGPANIKHVTPSVEDKKTVDGSQQKGQGENLLKDAADGSDKVPQGVSVTSAQFRGSFIEPPYPIVDQVTHQPVPSHYGPATLQQRPVTPPLGLPHQTPPQSHFGPQVPVHPSATSFVRGPGQYDLAQQSSELRSVAPHGPYNPVHSGAFGSPSSGVFPPSAFDSRGDMIARATPLGPDMRLGPHFPGSLEHGMIAPTMKSMNGFDPTSPALLRDERLRFQAERFNSFPAGPNRHMPDRAEFLDDMKQFPRPFDRGPHGLRYDPGLKMESMAVSSRFMPPYDGVRGRHEDPFGRMEPTRGNLDFFGAGPSFGRRHMEGLGSRSPGREHHGMPLRGYLGPGPDDIRGREVHRFGELFGGPFPESRFSMLHSHVGRGEFEGPGGMGMSDRLRNDFLGHDRFSSHLHKGERLGYMYDDFHWREPLGFGPHPRHARMRDIDGPGMDLFSRGDRPNHPHLGEPGFRSSFSHHGFPNDGGIITGEFAFDVSKKRKPPSAGWCRICKVDCETIEGLDLHSQTREHQKITMDIVVAIKQNAKRKKLTSGEQSSPGDASKSRNSGGEDHGKQN